MGTGFCISPVSLEQLHGCNLRVQSDFSDSSSCTQTVQYLTGAVPLWKAPSAHSELKLHLYLKYFPTSICKTSLQCTPDRNGMCGKKAGQDSLVMASISSRAAMRAALVLSYREKKGREPNAPSILVCINRTNAIILSNQTSTVTEVWGLMNVISLLITKTGKVLCDPPMAVLFPHVNWRAICDPLYSPWAKGHT